VILPETFTTGFPSFPDYRSEPLEGETLAWMERMAAETDAVITGSYLAETAGKVYNTLVWMRPDGNYDRYHKRHVFSMAGEDKVIGKGNQQMIVELNGWKINTMICYDLRFPVWSMNRTDSKGNYAYDLALYVANWPAVRIYPWTQLLIARAIENLSYVFAVNRIGHDPQGVFYNGHSMVVDPKGNLIEEVSEGKERAITAQLNHASLMEFREKFNVGRDWDAFNLTV